MKIKRKLFLISCFALGLTIPSPAQYHTNELKIKGTGFEMNGKISND